MLEVKGPLTRVQVEEVEAVEAGLMQDAQRFFLLTQTDNLWKEHLQVCSLLPVSHYMPLRF